MQKMLIFTERQLVPAAEVEDVGDVEICQSPISAETKARQAWVAVGTRTAAIEQVASIAKGLRKCVGNEEIQPVGELLFDLGLQAVVDAATESPLIAGALAEIRERYIRCGADVSWQKLRNPIVTNALLKIAAVGEHICRLGGEGIGQRILESQVCA